MPIDVMYQADIDATGCVARPLPTEEWVRANFPTSPIRVVRRDAVTMPRDLFREDTCILCGRVIGSKGGRGAHNAKLQHFRKHVRDGSLYDHNRPRAADAEGGRTHG